MQSEYAPSWKSFCVIQVSIFRMLLNSDNPFSLNGVKNPPIISYVKWALANIGGKKSKKFSFLTSTGDLLHVISLEACHICDLA